MSEQMDERYRQESIEPAGELDDWGRAWVAASRIAFAQGASNEENTRRWWQTSAEDGQRWDALFRESVWPGLGLDDVPVATFGTMTHDVNVGAGRLLPTFYIMDVSVRSTDRRQGLMRQMMESALRRAKDEGLALASLTATEGSIYGRFGFGVATRNERIEVDLGPRFQLLHAPDARVEVADPAAIGDLVADLHREFLTTHRGAHEPIAMRRQMLSGEWDWHAMAPATELRAAVAIGDQGPCGAVTWQVTDGVVRILDIVGDELPLWQHLSNLDLVDKARFRFAQPASPLRAALVDERVVEVTGVADAIWLRLLDVPAALEARGWDFDGTVAVLVDDELGLSGGCWRIVVSGGTAEVVPVDESEAELRLSVRELAELYLGTQRASVLAAAGRIQSDPAALRRLGQLFTTLEPAANLVFF